MVEAGWMLFTLEGVLLVGADKVAGADGLEASETLAANDPAAGELSGVGLDPKPLKADGVGVDAGCAADEALKLIFGALSCWGAGVDEKTEGAVAPNLKGVEAGAESCLGAGEAVAPMLKKGAGAGAASCFGADGLEAPKPWKAEDVVG